MSEIKNINAGFVGLQHTPKKDNSNQKFNPKFYYYDMDAKKYGKLLDALEWKGKFGETAIKMMPERYFRMMDEISDLCRYAITYDEERESHVLIAAVPNVFCAGQTLVESRVAVRKTSSHSDYFYRVREIDPDTPYVASTIGERCSDRTNPEKRECRCAYNICPADVALYLGYLKATHQENIIEECRRWYADHKDKVDLDDKNAWYFLGVAADVICAPYGRDYFVSPSKLKRARDFLDEGMYASACVSNDRGRFIYAFYDGTYERMGVTGFGKRNDTEPYTDLIVESRPAESRTRHQNVDDRNIAQRMLASESDFRQLSPCPYCDNEFCEMKYAAFADMLIQSGEYNKYLRKAKEFEDQHDANYTEACSQLPELEGIKRTVIVQNNFYGCVSGNSEADVLRIADLVGREVSLKPSVSPNIAHMTLLEFVKELSTNSYYKDANDYLISDWGNPASNQVYILSGISDFLKYIVNHDKELVGERLNRTLSRVEDHRYFILTGTDQELDRLFSEYDGIGNVFSLGHIRLSDMTASEIYEDLIAQLSNRLCSQITDEFKAQAIEYISLNQGVIPYNNKEMARYLAAYMHQNGLKLPDLHKVDVEKMLNDMIGMKDIKEKIQEFEAYAKYRKMAAANGRAVPNANMHMAFLGNPGTGKTTVARIVAQILFNIGLLRKNSVVEVQRKDLIAQYVGHTALKTQEVIDKAMGGVLFIDEAYALSPNGKDSGRDFGGESIATLIKAMEDNKDDLVVIFAGYNEEMNNFMNSNPGLQSRIGYTFNFEDYEEDELRDMFVRKMAASGYDLDEDLAAKVKDVCRYFKGTQDFGNGRFVDSLMQETLVRHSQNLDESKLFQVTADDVPDIEDLIKTVNKGWTMVNPKDISAEDLRRIAIHELGHAVVGYYLAGNMDIEKISVQADASGRLGYVRHSNKGRRMLETEEDMMHRLAVTLAGKNAERIVFHSHSGGCSSDIQRAKDLATRMVDHYAMGDWLEENAELSLLREADRMSKAALNEHLDKLESLADELVQRGEITEDEITAFLE